MEALVKVATFHNAFDAHFARNRLESEGLRAYIEGENTGLALSYVGSAIGGVHLLVAKEHCDHARELLRSDEEQNSTGVAWRCGECGEMVDPGFEMCWNCGAEQPSTASMAGVVLPEVSRDYSPPRSLPSASTFDHQNPFAPPQTTGRKSEAVKPANTSSDDSATLLDLAWRRAIIGLFFPPLMPMSMWSLVHALLAAKTWTEKQTIVTILIVLLNAFSGLLVVAILSYLSG